MKDQPPIDLIVTRHTHLVELIRERGLCPADTRVLSHVDKTEQVKGKHVLGVLPHRLSVHTASCTEIPMRWTEADREAMQRGDVDFDGTRRAAGEPVTYWVEKADHGAALGRAFAKAVNVATSYSGHFWTRTVQDEHHDAPRILVGGACEQIAAEVDLWRAWWRPIQPGPLEWRDAWGKTRELFRLVPNPFGIRLYESRDEAKRMLDRANIASARIELVEPTWADPRTAT
jgi:hypothetical protein